MHNADNFLSSFYYSLNYCQMPWCHCRPKGFVLKFVFVFIFFWLKLRIVQRRQARLKQGLKQAACEVYNANSQFLEQTKTIFFSITVSVFLLSTDKTKWFCEKWKQKCADGIFKEWSCNVVNCKEICLGKAKIPSN